MITAQNILDEAIRIATKAHEGQTDKGGSSYIHHPLRVMSNVYSMEEKITAVLHDVVEDTNISFYDLEHKGIPKVCIEALRLLTHDKDIPYMDYIKTISPNPIARAVKIADLKDNSDLSRLQNVKQKDIDRVDKYTKALDFLENQ